MIIEPIGVGSTRAGYANRSTINNATYVLCQNQDYYDVLQAGQTPDAENNTGVIGSPMADAENRYVHIKSADGTTHPRMIMVSPDGQGIIIKKKSDDVIYGTKGVSIEANAQPANILFTKIANPSVVDDDKNPF